MRLAMLEHPVPLALVDERLLVRDELLLALGPRHQIHRGELLIDL